MEIGIKYSTSLLEVDHTCIAQRLSETIDCLRQKEICRPNLGSSKALNTVSHGMLRCKIYD